MTTQPHIRFNKLSASIVAWLKRLLPIATSSRTSAQVRERQDYEHLAALPDYLLRDIGIKRSDLNLKLDKPFWWS